MTVQIMAIKFCFHVVLVLKNCNIQFGSTLSLKVFAAERENGGLFTISNLSKHNKRLLCCKLKVFMFSYGTK